MPKRTPHQGRISREQEDSPNRVSRTGGRSDGTEGLDGTSHTSDYLNKPNVNTTKSKGGEGAIPMFGARVDLDATPLPEVQSPNKKGNRIGAQDL